MCISTSVCDCCTKKSNNRVNFWVIVFFCLRSMHEKIFSHLHASTKDVQWKEMDIKNTISDLHKRFIGFLFAFVHIYWDVRTLIILPLLRPILSALCIACINFEDCRKTMIIYWCISLSFSWLKLWLCERTRAA